MPYHTAVCTVVLFAFVLASGTYTALAEATNVVFPGAKAEIYMRVKKVRGTLSMPDDVSGKVPAIIVLHGSGGIDGRGADHIRALNDSGIATLELHMFKRGSRPRSGSSSALPFAYGALRYLASRDDIASDKIGIMGFSFGANMTMHAAMSKAAEALGGGHRFAAHVAFYPTCWELVKWSNDGIKAGHGRYTGAPVLLLEGELDDYSDSGTCAKYLRMLPEKIKSNMTHILYPGATHGWDIPPGSDREIFDIGANVGKGGMVRFTHNSEIAERSRADTVSFFKVAFGL